ncbi:hypothetical protein ACFL3N_00285 [Candidatus Omnitrophota bacterium]
MGRGNSGPARISPARGSPGRFFMIVILTSAALVIPQGAQARKGKAERPAKKEETPEQRAARLKRLEEKRRLAEEKKEELDNTRWEIKVKPTSEEVAEYAETDTLVFENKKFFSKYYRENGYPETNFTVKVAPNQTVVWETMQTKEGEGVMFWRGERRGDYMKGLFSKRYEKDDVRGKIDTFSFVTPGISPPKRPVVKAPPEKPKKGQKGNKEKIKKKGKGKAETKKEEGKKWWWQ